MQVFIGRQKQRRDFTVFTGPVKQDFLLFSRQIIRSVRLTDVLVNAAGWVAKEKSFEALCVRGFIYWSVSKVLFIQLNITWFCFVSRSVLCRSFRPWLSKGFSHLLKGLRPSQVSKARYASSKSISFKALMHCINSFELESKFGFLWLICIGILKP